MPRKPESGLTPEQIKDKADKAEGKKQPKSEKRMGKSPDYQESYAIQAEKLTVLGATDVDLADFFEVSINTIKRWKTRHEAFGASLKVGKGASDDRVEHSLYQRAVGYTFDSELVKVVNHEVVRIPRREHVPPDTTAQIFWLKNRRPDLWRDVHKHELGKAGDFDHMSADELRESIARDIADLGSEDATSAHALREGKPAGSGRPN